MHIVGWMAVDGKPLSVADDFAARVVGSMRH
jgi:hypothetical protein